MIEKASDIKKLMEQGWELWHIGKYSALSLPGRWEMRFRNQTKEVSWDAIVVFRRLYLDWARQNTTEVEEGLTWIYSYIGDKQTALNLG